MLPQNNPDRIRILFDDHRLVANAGLLLSATLARHLGLRELVDHHLDLGGAPGRAKRRVHSGNTAAHCCIVSVVCRRSDVANLRARRRPGRQAVPIPAPEWRTPAVQFSTDTCCSLQTALNML